MIIFNRTKIIATIGPATATKELLKELVQGGVDVFRFNFSHGTHDQKIKLLQMIKEINVALKTNVGTIADLQGPKIRIGLLSTKSIRLKAGQEFVLSTKTFKGTSKRVSIDYPRFPKDVSVDDKILIDDGKIELTVTYTNKKDTVKALVKFDSILLPKKGVNLPNTNISLPSMTKKDKIDLKFILENDFDWVALSFVRSGNDITKIKEIIRKKKKHMLVIAKIEKPAAVSQIKQIINRSDAIMVARGDLGVEVPAEQVPIIQKNIVHLCRIASKPVIIATQIMESMVKNPGPTRAEVTDVANVVYEGADALMLSAETAIGKFPTKVISTIVKILSSIEKEDRIYLSTEDNKNMHLPSRNSRTYLSDALSYNVCKIATELHAKAIIGMTRSGYTAYEVSSYRPKTLIYIFTNNKAILNKLSMVWGVRAYYYNKYVSTDETIYDVKHELKKKGIVRKGDIIVNTASMPIHAKDRTNMLKVSRVE